MQSKRLVSQISLENRAKSVHQKRVLVITGGSIACLFAFCAARVLAQPAISPVASPLSGTTAIAPAIKSNAPAIGMPVGAQSPLPTSQGVMDLQIIDTPVVDVVNIIRSAAGGEFDIVVASDVDERLKSISLTNRTPEDAIRLVAQATGLTLTRVDSRTFILSKGAVNGAPKIDSAAQFLETVENNLGGFDPRGLAKSDIPDLAKIKDGDEEAETRTQKYVSINNVRPSIMAYWLDPANHPKPKEFQISDDRLNQTIDDILSPRELELPSRNKKSQETAFRNDFVGANSSPYNPYAPYNPYNPYVQSSPQIGGGRQNNNNNNNRQNNNGGGGGGGSLNSIQGTLPLPAGIDAMVAVDPQNALLVYGTEEGITQIRQIIEFLDRPIAQVEIEAQFVSVSKDATKQFGIQAAYKTGDLTGAVPSENGAVGNFIPSAGGGTTPLVIGFTRGNFQAVLTALNARGQARLLNAPRVTTFNNLTAQIRSTRIRTVEIEDTIIVPDEDGNIVTSATRLIQFAEGTILTVTPTINRDGTITIAMQPVVAVNLPRTDSDIPDQESQQIDTISNIRDGDTLAIGGLRSATTSESENKIPILGDLPLLGKLFRNKSKITSERDLIIFVTARIVRRINEPVRGT